MLVRHLPTAGQTAHAFKIRAGENPHNTGHRCGGGRVHSIQRAMCNVRAQEEHMCLSCDIHIIRVIALTGQKPNVLTPLWRRSNA
jgi:hypothetical protein